MSKNLYRIKTVSTIINEYVVEADFLEDAEKAVINDDFESVIQVCSEEVIFDSKRINKEKFEKMLKKAQKNGTGSHWMGEQLIHKVGDLDNENF